MGEKGNKESFTVSLTIQMDLCSDTFERKWFVPVSTWLPRGYSLCRLDRAVMDLPGTSKTQPSRRETSKRRIKVIAEEYYSSKIEDEKSSKLLIINSDVESLTMLRCLLEIRMFFYLRLAPRLGIYLAF